MITGKITKGIGGIYYVYANDKFYECCARGIFRKDNIVPTVGDYVKISLDNMEKGVIEDILERENFLIRPRVSNIECAIITFSLKSPTINIQLLDKFLIMAENQKISDIVICINKIDLVEEKDLNKFLQIYEKIYKVFPVSTIENSGLEEIKSHIDKKVTVFAGPSGVGKSSIINNILQSNSLKTGEISKKIGRGKHTTREVELLKAWEDTFIVDSPGFTSLSTENIEASNLDFYFKEFRQFLGECKFSDCNHIHEPDCKVKNNLGSVISNERYENYLKIIKELD